MHERLNMQRLGETADQIESKSFTIHLEMSYSRLAIAIRSYILPEETLENSGKVAKQLGGLRRIYSTFLSTLSPLGIVCSCGKERACGRYPTQTLGRATLDYADLRQAISDNLLRLSCVRLQCISLYAKHSWIKYHRLQSTPSLRRHATDNADSPPPPLQRAFKP